MITSPKVDWVGRVGFGVVEPTECFSAKGESYQGWKPIDPPLTEEELNSYIEAHVKNEIADVWWTPKGCTYSWKLLDYEYGFVHIELTRYCK